MGGRKSVKNVIIAVVVVGIIAFIAAAVTSNTLETDTRQKEAATALADKEAQIADLIAKVDEYAALGGEFTERKSPATPCKVFIVQNNFTPGVAQTPDEGFTYSPIYFDLPEELQAKSPEELNTIVQLNIFEVITGKYTSGNSAYTLHVEMTVIDTTKSEVIFHNKTILEPITNPTNDDQLHRQIPKYEIIAMIEDLAGYVEK